MKQICPCCKKREFSPPSITPEDDLSDLITCDYCASILKWSAGNLEVVHESKAKPELGDLGDADQGGGALGEGDQEELALGEPALGDADQEELDLAEGALGEPALDDADQEELDLAEGALGEPALEETEDHNQSEPDQEDFLLSSKEETEGEEALGEAVAEGTMEEESLREPNDDLDSLKPETPPDLNQDFSDVEKYGNANASGDKGFLRYDLRISGLDSLEIEEEVLSVLEDPRFKWSAREILESQKEGVLEIKNLNPVKAMCLVSSLSFVSVELSWKQYMALNVSEE